MDLFNLRLRFFVILFLTILSGYSIYAFEKQECELYGVIDIELTYTKSRDPFGLVLKGIFVGPNNEELEIPGFYNGKGKYVIRFSPVSTGIWKYNTISSEPKLSDSNFFQCLNN